MGTHYGPYVMYILSQLMQKRAAGQQGEISGTDGLQGTEHAAAVFSEAAGTNDFFAADETGAKWHREENLELLQHFCREGYGQARRHGHFLIGTSEEGSYIAIPGRFLLEDQPAGGKTGFTLWQPLRGGEGYYADLADIEEDMARRVYGYWIACLNPKTLEISEV